MVILFGLSLWLAVRGRPALNTLFFWSRRSHSASNAEVVFMRCAAVLAALGSGAYLIQFAIEQR
jgi:hypothetical protein